MKIAECWKEEGVTIPAPYERTIKAIFAPDKGGVDELLFTQAIIYPHSQTDLHTHDRGELIYVISGRGFARSSGGETPISTDVAIWAEKGELHQIVNTGDESMKLATVFVPPYTAKENYDRCVEAAKAQGQ